MISVKGKMYDGVAIKPELDDALEHYGVKGMKTHRIYDPKMRDQEKKKQRLKRK